MRRNWVSGLTDDSVSSNDVVHEQVRKRAKKIALIDSRKCPYASTISLDAASSSTSG